MWYAINQFISIECSTSFGTNMKQNTSSIHGIQKQILIIMHDVTAVYGNESVPTKKLRWYESFNVYILFPSLVPQRVL